MKLIFLAILASFSSLSFAWNAKCTNANGEPVHVGRSWNLHESRGYIKVNGQFFLGLYALRENCHDGQSYFVYRPENKSVVMFRCDAGTLSAGAYDRDNLWCEI